MVVRRSELKKKKNSDLAGVGSVADLNYTHVVAASNKSDKHHGHQQQKQGQASSQESSGKADVKSSPGFELAERKRSEVSQLLYVDMQKDSAYEVATAMLKLSDLMSEKLQAKKEEEKGDDDKSHDSYWDDSSDEEEDDAKLAASKKPPVNLGKQNKKLVFALGGHALILVKMEEYIHDEYVQLYGLKCLKMLCYNGYDDADVAIIQASGIEQIMDSMKSIGSKSAQVQICGLTALINLFKKIGFTPLYEDIQNTTNPDEREEKDKGMELIHSAIRRFMYVELNGTEFVLNIMKEFADDEKIQGYSIWLINIMLAAELDKLSEEVFNPSAAKKREYLQTTKFMDCVGMIGDAIKNHREQDNNVKVQGAQFMKSLFGNG